MADAAALGRFFEHVQAHQDYYVRRLAEAVAIPRCVHVCARACGHVRRGAERGRTASVSADLGKRADCVRMADWLFDELKQLGAEYVPTRARAPASVTHTLSLSLTHTHVQGE
jgi:hypothetical protein